MLRRISALVGLVMLASLAAHAAEPNVKSFDLTLSDQTDEPIIRSILQTKAGGAYSPATLATDLQRLGMLKYIPAILDATFAPDGVSLKLTASESDQFPMIYASTVEITGGDDAVNAACLRQMNQQASTIFRKRPLEFPAVLRDVDLIAATYQSRGWLDARVVRAGVELGTDGQSARVHYQIDPGKPFTIGKTIVTTAGKLDRDETQKALNLPPGTAWTDSLRQETINRALSVCGEKGFLEAKAVVTADKQPDATIHVRIDIAEGDQIVLRQAVVQGADELKDQIARLITLKKDQPVKRADTDALQHAIEDLGVFRDVELLWVPLRDQPEGHRDLVIRVIRSNRPGQPTPAEQLYYDVAKKLVRLYNGQDECRSIRIKGFVTSGGRRIDLDAAVVRPDRARLKLAIAGDKGGNPAELVFTKIGDKSDCSIGPLGKKVPLPTPLCLRVDFTPPDFASRKPAAVQLSLETGPQILKAGTRCSPVAVYYTRQAIFFPQRPPSIEKDILVLPGQDGSSVRIAVNGLKLPKHITWIGRDGKTDADLEFELNAADIEKESAGWKIDAPADAAGMALLAPVLWMLQMPDEGLRLGENAAAAHPGDPACLAARGLIRLASSPPKTGLADLRKAAELSPHPAYKMLLGEMFIRGKDFAEAAALFADVAKADPKPGPLAEPDLLLASGLSLQSVADTLAVGPPDYRVRAAIGRVVALIGMADYASAEAVAKDLLKTHPDDLHAMELVARCELSQGHAAPALDFLNKVKPADQTSQMDLYAAMCHVWLNDDAKASDALGRAFKKSPAARNLLYLQDQAGEIHAHFKQAAVRAALARAFSNAVIGDRSPEERAQLAAIVNDGYVLKSDVDLLVQQAAERNQVKPDQMAELRQVVLNQLIEDMLVLRWAIWRGIQISDDDVYRSLQDEMAQMGAANVDAYDAMLRERGSSLLLRSRELRDGLLKQAAFSLALTDKIRVTPAQVDAFYKANPNEFTIPPMARMRMITLEFTRFNEKQQARDLAQSLLRRVKEKPDTFEQVAREYSHDPNAERGGLWEHVTQSSLIEPLDKTVFALKPNEISGVIESTRGCHIVKLESITPEKKRTLEEAGPHILRGMQQAIARQAIPAWLEQLKAESCIQIFK